MHVYWLQQALPDLPAGDDWLTAGESARLAALHVPKRRADWRLGRWTAKHAVLAYLRQREVLPIRAVNVGLQDIELRSAPSGAPEVFLRGEPAPVTISVTHSSGRAVCAIGPIGVALGCDLESIEPRSAGFLADYFTAEEQALVARSSLLVRDRIITLLWSAKESALKALRTGLRVDTRDLSVTPRRETGDGWHSLAVRFSSAECFDGWWRERAGFMLTVAAVPSPAPPMALDVATCVAHTPA